MSTTTTSPAWRRLTAIVLGTGAIAFGGMAVLAPVAYAQPNNGGSESEGQKECREAGGDFTSGTDQDGTVESCCYQGMIAGVTHCDVWTNGKWDKDKSFHELPPATPPSAGGPPNAGGTPEMSPDEQNPTPKTPKIPPRKTIPGQAQVVTK